MLIEDLTEAFFYLNLQESSVIGQDSLIDERIL